MSSLTLPSGLHSTPGSQYCLHGRTGGVPPALNDRFPLVPTSGVRSPVIHQFPTLGFDPRGDSIYDKSLTGEPILPSRTANQYLVREPISGQILVRGSRR